MIKIQKLIYANNFIISNMSVLRRIQGRRREREVELYCILYEYAPNTPVNICCLKAVFDRVQLVI